MDPVNGVMMQYFEWYVPANASLWNELSMNAGALAAKGITGLWIPPCYKGSGGLNDVGYGVYDLYDLGEFDQKNSIPTKYGTRADFLRALETAKSSGIAVYADIVFNHKDGGDETEKFLAQEVNWDDRNETESGWYLIEAYTKFTFPGRKGKYSGMIWNHECFDALTYNALTKNNDHLYRIKNKTFSTQVSHEHGNDDYLMANDLDTSYDPVRKELLHWAQWFYRLTRIDGFRIDACKHIRFSFFDEWLTSMRTIFNEEFFSVGEYWSGDVNDLHDYISATGGIMSLFDVPLHYNFFTASNSWDQYDMRQILSGTLMEQQPVKAVTFVDNHDTQPCQALESPVQDWFKPLAYALILLRGEGYPCIFYADYFGASYSDKNRNIKIPSVQALLDQLLFARKAYGFGNQEDYFDHPNTIGWTRLGNDAHPGSMAVVLTNGSAGYKDMNMYRSFAVYADCTGNVPGTVKTDERGWATFPCPAGGVSVWLEK